MFSKKTRNLAVTVLAFLMAITLGFGVMGFNKAEKVSAAATVWTIFDGTSNEVGDDGSSRSLTPNNNATVGSDIVVSSTKVAGASFKVGADMYFEEVGTDTYAFRFSSSPGTNRYLSVYVPEDYTAVIEFYAGVNGGGSARDFGIGTSSSSSNLTAGGDKLSVAKNTTTPERYESNALKGNATYYINTSGGGAYIFSIKVTFEPVIPAESEKVTVSSLPTLDDAAAYVGESYALPAKLNATLADGKKGDAFVEWTNELNEVVTYFTPKQADLGKTFTFTAKVDSLRANGNAETTLKLVVKENETVPYNFGYNANETVKNDFTFTEGATYGVAKAHPSSSSTSSSAKYGDGTDFLYLTLGNKETITITTNLSFANILSIKFDCIASSRGDVKIKINIVDENDDNNVIENVLPETTVQDLGAASNNNWANNILNTSAKLSSGRVQFVVSNNSTSVRYAGLNNVEIKHEIVATEKLVVKEFDEPETPELYVGDYYKLPPLSAIIDGETAPVEVNVIWYFVRYTGDEEIELNVGENVTDFTAEAAGTYVFRAERNDDRFDVPETVEIPNLTIIVKDYDKKVIVGLDEAFETNYKITLGEEFTLPETIIAYWNGIAGEETVAEGQEVELYITWEDYDISTVGTREVSGTLVADGYELGEFATITVTIEVIKVYEPVNTYTFENEASKLYKEFAVVADGITYGIAKNNPNASKDFSTGTNMLWISSGENGTNTITITSTAYYENIYSVIFDAVSDNNDHPKYTINVVDEKGNVLQTIINEVKHRDLVDGSSSTTGKWWTNVEKVAAEPVSGYLQFVLTANAGKNAAIDNIVVKADSVEIPKMPDVETKTEVKEKVAHWDAREQTAPVTDNDKDNEDFILINKDGILVTAQSTIVDGTPAKTAGGVTVNAFEIQTSSPKTDGLRPSWVKIVVPFNARISVRAGANGSGSRSFSLRDSAESNTAGKEYAKQDTTRGSTDVYKDDSELLVANVSAGTYYFWNTEAKGNGAQVYEIVIDKVIESSSCEYEAGQTLLNESALPSYEGYTFVGWVAPSGNVEAAGAAAKESGFYAPLYAKVTATTSVRLGPNGGIKYCFTVEFINGDLLNEELINVTLTVKATNEATKENANFELENGVLTSNAVIVGWTEETAPLWREQEVTATISIKFGDVETPVTGDITASAKQVATDFADENPDYAGLLGMYIG